MKNDDMRDQLRKLERSLAELEKAARKLVGRIRTFEYKGIQFHVTGKLVVADLSPLAFFELAESLSDEDPRETVMHLHNRIVPLLGCQHQWTPLKRAADTHVRSLFPGLDEPGASPYVCRACTAYAAGVLNASLPAVGRTPGTPPAPSHA